MSIGGARQILVGSKNFRCLILTDCEMLVRTYRLPNPADAFKALYLWCLCKGKQSLPQQNSPLDNAVPCFQVCPEPGALGLKVLPRHDSGSSCEPCYAVAFTEVPLTSVLSRRVTQSSSTKADADTAEGNQFLRRRSLYEPL